MSCRNLVADSLKRCFRSMKGAKRVGELRIGMNKGINKFTGNILIDEKMGGIRSILAEFMKKQAGLTRVPIHKSMKDGGAMYFDGIPIVAGEIEASQ